MWRKSLFERHIIRKDNLREFHEKIKRLRLENNKTQDEIAEYLGVGRTTVVNYEHGRIRPNLENIRKLSNLYNVTCDYLLEWYFWIPMKSYFNFLYNDIFR